MSIADSLESTAARLLTLAQHVRAIEDGAVDGMRLLTAGEVRDLTGLSRGRVYELGREGELGAVKIGQRGIRFSKAQLDAWMRRRRKGK